MKFLKYKFNSFNKDRQVSHLLTHAEALMERHLDGSWPQTTGKNYFKHPSLFGFSKLFFFFFFGRRFVEQKNVTGNLGIIPSLSH